MPDCDFEKLNILSALDDGVIDLLDCLQDLIYNPLLAHYYRRGQSVDRCCGPATEVIITRVADWMECIVPETVDCIAGPGMRNCIFNF